MYAWKEMVSWMLRGFVRSVLLGLLAIALTLGDAKPCLSSDQAVEVNQSGTLSTNADLVLVSVQVRGTGGMPLHGLQRGDFLLRSDGRLQVVKVFEEFILEPSERNPATRTVNPPTTALQEFSNVPEGGMPQRLLIIAIDWVNAPYMEQGWAQRELVKYFAKATPDQPIALVAITEDGLVQIHAPSSDPSALLEALHSEKGRLGKAERDAKTSRQLGLPETALTRRAEAAERKSTQTRAIDATILSFEQLENA
jgi:hypothetical protein